MCSNLPLLSLGFELIRYASLSSSLFLLRIYPGMRKEGRQGKEAAKNGKERESGNGGTAKFGLGWVDKFETLSNFSSRIQVDLQSWASFLVWYLEDAFIFSGQHNYCHKALEKITTG